VLHTWGQNLHHHPHVHCVVPGGGPSPDGTRWIGCRPGFFLPVRVLSRLFRRLFLDQLRAAFEAGTLGAHRIYPPAPRAAPGRVGRLCQAALRRTFAGVIRRFLLHTLPDGFHRIRHYGFLANGHRAAKLALCRKLLDILPPSPSAVPVDKAATPFAFDHCPCCGGTMIILATLPRSPLRRTSFWNDSS